MSPMEASIRDVTWGLKLDSEKQAMEDFKQRWANSTQRKELAEADCDVYSHSRIRQIKKADKIIRKDIGIALLDPSPWIRKYALLIEEYDHLKWKKTKKQSYEEVEHVNNVAAPILKSKN